MYDGANVVGELTKDNYYIYYRATELIGYKAYTGESYCYRQNAHGDVTAMLDMLGNEVRNYTYDAFGEKQALTAAPMGDQTILYQWKAETENVHNPFGYCGEYTDAETGLVYLRNRMYSPEIGRFITEDPIKDGLNWYVYCGNNPIMFIDYWGLEDIVVSGGAYHEGNGEYQYEFVDTALLQIQALGGGATLLVANAGWTEQQYGAIEQACRERNINLLWFSSRESLISYVNYGRDRNKDPITSFYVFAHGTDANSAGKFTGNYSITFGLYTDKDENLRLYTSDISKINGSSFAKGVVSKFYACRTGNTFDNGNFALAWAQKTGGAVYAYKGDNNLVGRSDFSDILGTWSERHGMVNKSEFGRWKNARGKITKKPGEAFRLPKASTGSTMTFFYPTIFGTSPLF